MTDHFAQKAVSWDNPDKIDMTQKFLSAMLDKIKPEKSWKALEIGAGTGLVGIELLPMVDSILFEDVSESMMDMLHSKLDGSENASFLLGAVTEIEAEDFDFVFSSMAFHHIENMHETAQHLAKIMREGGILAIGDLHTEDGSFHRFDPIPHKGFDPEKLAETFLNNGFELLSLSDYNILSRERTPGIFTDYAQFLLVLRRKA